MRHALSVALRRVVLLALVPSCGGAVTAESKNPPEAGRVDDANGADDDHPQLDGATYQDAFVADLDAREADSHVSPDGEGPDREVILDGGSDVEPIDATADAGCQAYEDGGTGACAPYWIQGNGCTGGEVFFPCGLPSGGGGGCVPYCMGNPALSGCWLVNDSGLGGIPPWDLGDAGPVPAIVGCAAVVNGRRPAVLVDEPPAVARTIGEFLARCAYLEEASVGAFLELAAQLGAHGAPDTLLSRLHQAASEEVRHARDMSALARTYGAEPPAARVEESGYRSLFAIALENAREGCVRETWGAACALVQSMCAADPRVRATMRTIAEDELSHAALAWDLARWIEARLSPEERARVDVERARAVAELESELEQSSPEAWRVALGWPTRDEARAILRGMHTEVWKNAA
jgi:hypothetical protein